MDNLDDQILVQELISFEKMIKKDEDSLIKVLDDFEKFDFGIFKFKNEINRINKKFQILNKTIQFEIDKNQIDSINKLNEEFHRLFDTLYLNYVKKYDNDYYVRFVVESNIFDSPVSTHLINRSQFTTQLIADTFDNAFQSKKKQNNLEISSIDLFKVSIIVAKKLVGKGKRKFNQDKLKSSV